MMEIEIRSNRSTCLENLLWNGLRTKLTKNTKRKKQRIDEDEEEYVSSYWINFGKGIILKI
jgi:hypothetical protein